MGIVNWRQVVWDGVDGREGGAYPSWIVRAYKQKSKKKEKEKKENEKKRKKRKKEEEEKMKRKKE